MKHYVQQLRTLAIVGSAVPLAACGQATKNKSEQPNIILILVDDLGKEWISQCGAELIKTPNIDALAIKGMEFSRAYSMPQSTPSRAVLMTGQYPYENGWINHFDVPRWGYGAHFDTECNPSFPLQLQAAGYRTCVAGKWQINDFRLEPEAMKKVGFDEYFMWTGAEVDNIEKSQERYWNPYIHSKEGSKTYEGKFGPDLYSGFIIDFLRENKDKPMFVYYPMTLTHTPFVHTPHHMEAKTKYEKHTAMVEYTDYIIGQLLQTVEELGIADNTYFFFTTDNGTVSTVIGKRKGQIVAGGKTLLSENGINAPLFVLGPGIPKGHVATQAVDFCDIAPTIIELAHAKPITRFTQNGTSLVPLLKGKTKGIDKPYALSMGGHPAYIGTDGRVHNVSKFRDRALIFEQYKVVLTREKTIDRIYDIDQDPWERNNLVDQAKVLKACKKRVAEVLRNIPAQDNDPKYTPISPNPYAEIRDAKLTTPSTKHRPNYQPPVSEEKFLKFINETQAPTKKKK